MHATRETLCDAGAVKSEGGSVAAHLSKHDFRVSAIVHERQKHCLPPGEG